MGKRVRGIVRLLVLAGTSWLVAAGLPQRADAQTEAPAEPSASAAAPSATATVPSAPPAPPGDDAAAEAKKQAAKERFLRGLELVQNEQWDAALAEFLASRELYPTRAALKNAAVSLRQLGRFAESLDMYREMLRLFHASIPADERATIDAAMVQLSAHVGEIEITSQPLGATVIVDGVERGVTPLSGPLTVHAGTRSVRVFREGYVPLETQVSVAGKQRKQLSAKLRAIAQAGRLVVNDASGGRHKVVVDGVVVGQAPWSGTLEAGAHTVFLRGEDDMGTMPSRATVVAGQTSTLTLRAVKLDAEIRVSPTPVTARVDIDGIPLGQGHWFGRLTSGRHHVEVSAEGFLAHRRDIDLPKGGRQVLRIILERDLSDPRWREAFRMFPYVDAFVGGAWAPGLGGSTSRACADDGCSEHARPLGFVVGARGGLQVTRVLGVELAFGYLTMRESSTRRAQSATADYALMSSDYEDSTVLRGPLAALCGVVQPWGPARFRVWAGAVRATGELANAGTFQGTAVRPDDPSVSSAFVTHVSVPESRVKAWIPFVGPEARVGFSVTESIELDAGLALWVMFAPETPRTGRSARDRSRQERSVHLPDIPAGYPDGSTLQPGVAVLDRETAFGTSFVLLPSIGGRLHL